MILYYLLYLFMTGLLFKRDEANKGFAQADMGDR